MLVVARRGARRTSGEQSNTVSFLGRKGTHPRMGVDSPRHFLDYSPAWLGRNIVGWRARVSYVQRSDPFPKTRPESRAGRGDRDGDPGDDRHDNAVAVDGDGLGGQADAAHLGGLDHEAEHLHVSFTSP